MLRDHLVSVAPPLSLCPLELQGLPGEVDQVHSSRGPESAQGESPSPSILHTLHTAAWRLHLQYLECLPGSTAHQGVWSF